MIPQWLLLLNALVLGFKHGVDWDHIAAIVDIVGTCTTNEIDNTVTFGQRSFTYIQRRAVYLSLFYALGHSCVVGIIGVVAIYFAAVLPKWIDPIMERIVGITLLLLGFWITYSLVQFGRGRSDFKIRSRWMVAFAFLDRGIGWLRNQLTGHKCHHKTMPNEYGPRAALGVGMIHGIGAETGTQVLLIASIAGNADQSMALTVLLAFTTGFVLSNTLVAVISATGFIASSRLKPLYLVAGALTAVLSIVVGVYFLFDQGEALPDLSRFWKLN